MEVVPLVEAMVVQAETVVVTMAQVAAGMITGTEGGAGAPVDPEGPVAVAIQEADRMGHQSQTGMKMTMVEL